MPICIHLLCTWNKILFLNCSLGFHISLWGPETARRPLIETPTVLEGLDKVTAHSFCAWLKILLSNLHNVWRDSSSSARSPHSRQGRCGTASWQSLKELSGQWGDATKEDLHPWKRDSFKRNQNASADIKVKRIKQKKNASTVRVWVQKLIDGVSELRNSLERDNQKMGLWIRPLLPAGRSWRGESASWRRGGISSDGHASQERPFKRNWDCSPRWFIFQMSNKNRNKQAKDNCLWFCLSLKCYTGKQL